LSTSTAELVEQLAHTDKRNVARAELVNRGSQATPALLSAAGKPRDLLHYKTILRTLLMIKDPQSESLFRGALESGDEEVRALGARGLYLLKVPDVLRILKSVINDASDALHFEQTPAVQSLIELGMDALPTVFNLLDSADERTRRRAHYVLAAVVLGNITRRLQPKSLTSDAQTAWEELRQTNGSYQWDGSESTRRASIDLWKKWFARVENKL
jgi:hypothetical protein